MSCTSIATATEFTTVTSDSLSTSFSSSISTLPATTTTIDSLSCVPTTTGNVTTSSCSTVETVSTIAGGTTTVQVPVVLTFPVTSSSPTATLFSTSCSDGGSISSSSTTTSIGSTSTSTEVIVTTVPTTVTYQSSFTSDGTVIYTSGTSTTFAVTTQTSVIPVSPGNNSVNDSSNTSAIVGGAVGGGVGAIILSLVAWFLLRRKRRHDFDDDLFLPDAIRDDQGSKHVLRRNGEKGAVIDAEPRPYTYGALSSAGPSSTAHTPSTEGPPMGPAYGRPMGSPPPPPHLPPLQMGQAKNLPPAPYPVPSQSHPSHSSMSSPPGFGPYNSNHSLPIPLAAPPPTSVNPSTSAAASTSTLSNPGGYDPRRPLHVVNDFGGSSTSVASAPAHLAAAMQGYLPSQSEKAQVYLHPQTGLSVVPERPEASGLSAYVSADPRGPGSAEGARSAVGGSMPRSAPGMQTDPPRVPIVHQDAGRAKAPGGPVDDVPRMSESDAPPAYSE